MGSKPGTGKGEGAAKHTGSVFASYPAVVGLNLLTAGKKRSQRVIFGGMRFFS